MKDKRGFMQKDNNVRTVGEYGSLRIYQKLDGTITRIEKLDGSELWEVSEKKYKDKISKGEILYLQTWSGK